MCNRDIVGQFVDLVWNHDWQKNEVLPDNDVELLLEVVRAAGFEPSSLAFGRLRGNYLDQDGRPNGSTYPINQACPYKVTDQENGDLWLATGWLDCLVRYALKCRPYGYGQSPKASAIEKVQAEIENALPLEPIQLSSEGDMLREDSPRENTGAFPYLVSHKRDDNELDDCAGVHKFCGGFLDRHHATERSDSLCCRKCYLRVLFPKEVVTLGDLRRELSAKLYLGPA